MTIRGRGWITIDDRRARRRSQYLWPFPPSFHLPEGVIFLHQGIVGLGSWGSWAVQDDRLYLIDCGGTVRDEVRPAHRRFNLIDLTGNEEPLLADWITTTIQASIGEPIDEEPMFEGAVYATYDDLRIERGIVVERSIITWDALCAREQEELRRKPPAR